MGVTLGTLTTKDGQVIPLPTAQDAIEELNADEYRREEEGRYRKCVHRPIVHGVWDIGIRETALGPVCWSGYKVRTENLKRRGERAMGKPIDYTTVKFRLFEHLFKHPKEWISTRTLAEVARAPVDSVSATLGAIRKFLFDEGLAKIRDMDGFANAKEIMFIGEADKPEEEARLWYTKMLTRRAVRKSKAPSPAPQTATARTSSSVQPVQVDTQTMEAIIRVPLDKLAEVLKLMS
jgi:hypothetical protein